MSNITYPKYKLPDNLVVSSATASAGFSGSFIGDGSQLENLPLGDYVTKVEASGTFISGSQLAEILTDYTTEVAISGTFVSQSQLTNILLEYPTLNDISGTFVSSSQLTQILSDYPTLNQVSGTFVSQSQIENFITGVATFGNLTGSGLESDPIILKDKIYINSETCSFTMGTSSLASGDRSMAIGANSFAYATDSFVQGTANKANGEASHAEGANTYANNPASHAEGLSTNAGGHYSHAEGENTKTYGTGSHAEGYAAEAWGNHSHAEGVLTKASGVASHAEGINTLASGNYSHAEGGETIAYGIAAHSEGAVTRAKGDYSHAEGQMTEASGSASHAEGVYTFAYGEGSHSEGNGAIAFGPFSHAEGKTAFAYGTASHAEGFSTKAFSDYSHVEGNNTIASASYQHVQGQWNQTSSTALHLIGNGAGEEDRRNIFEVYTDKVVVSGSQEVSGDLSASYFYGDGSNLINVPQPTIPDVSENLTFYVSQNGNNATANGTLSKPFLTVQAAVDYVSSSVDHTASVVIKVAPGSYVAPQLTRRNTYFVSTALKTESRSVTFSGMTHVSCSSVSQGAYNNVVGFQGIFFTKGGSDTDPTFKISTNGYTVFLKDCYVAASSNTDSNAVLLTSDLITGVNGSKLVAQNSIFWKEKSSADLLRISGGYTKLDSCEFYYSSISGSGNGIGHTGTLGASVVIGDRLLIDLPTSGSAISSSVGSLSSPGFLLSNSSANVSGSNIVFRTGGHMLLSSVLVNSTGGSINYVSGSGLASSFVSYGNITCLNPTRAFVINNATPIPLTEYHGTIIASSITSSISGTLIGPAGGILSGSYPNPSGLSGGTIPIATNASFATPSNTNISFNPSGSFSISTKANTGSSRVTIRSENGGQYLQIGTVGIDNGDSSINIDTGEIATEVFNNGQINIGRFSKDLSLIHLGTSAQTNTNFRIHIGKTESPIHLGGPIVNNTQTVTITNPASSIKIKTPSVYLAATSSLTMSARPSIEYANYFGNNYSPSRNASDGVRVSLTNISDYSICFLNDNSSTGSLPDNQGLHPSSSLKLGSAQRVLNKWGTLELQYHASGGTDAGFWVETGFCNNLTGSTDLSQYALLSGSTITASSLYTNYIDFNTTAYPAPPPPPAQLGRIFYNGSNGDLSTYLDTTGLTLNNGQQLVQRCQNKSGSPILKGTVVHLSGSDGLYDTPRINVADWSNDDNSANTLGLAMQDIAIDATGYVITQGLLAGLSLTGMPLTPANGQVLYLSSSGQITNVKPVAPKHTVSIGQLIAKASTPNNKFVYVSIQNGYELDELHDVSASVGKTNGDLLAWDSTNTVWKNTKELSGSYSISGSLTLGDILKAPQMTKVNSDPGELGQICWDNNNIYVYTNAGWKSGSLN